MNTRQFAHDYIKRVCTDIVRLELEKRKLEREERERESTEPESAEPEICANDCKTEVSKSADSALAEPDVLDSEISDSLGSGDGLRSSSESSERSEPGPDKYEFARKMFSEPLTDDCYEHGQLYVYKIYAKFPVQGEPPISFGSLICDDNELALLQAEAKCKANGLQLVKLMRSKKPVTRGLS